jgi:hypothetical protein
MGDESHFVFRQKLLGEDGSVRRGHCRGEAARFVLAKFGATSSHVFTQSSQNVAVEPEIHTLTCSETAA